MTSMGAAAEGQYPQARGNDRSGTQGHQQAFMVLRMAPLGGAVAADTIQARCEGIPGVSAVRVDVQRGNLHLLYDGTGTAIEQVMHALQLLDIRLRPPWEPPR